MFNQNLFVKTEPPIITIPENCDVVFVSDMFSQDHLGGAELTTDALIDASDMKVYRLHSRNVTLDLLAQGSKKYWIFGNFVGMNLDLVPTIVSNLNYSIVEYDYKYCRYRSPEKHASAENEPCGCHNEIQGKMVSAFYHGSNSLFWMSESQMNRYHQMFPFLVKNLNTVLSSIFSPSTLDHIREIRNQNKEKNDVWKIVGSTSWIKGVSEAENYCKENNLDYEVIFDLSHKELLENLGNSKGLIFLPLGGDTCPRAVIEAKLLGCKLILNENVQHATEGWFDTDDLEEIESYLRERPEVFWQKIKATICRTPTLSGYTTTLNCIEQDYPFEESIRSMLNFCDQVVVVDGGSSDGTWDSLLHLSREFDSLVIHQKERDWSHPRFAVFDGLQKALARAYCTGDFCWQQDSDETVHETFYERIKDLIYQCPKSVNLIALPVIEYWGPSEKVRVDVTPWKWRLSRNRNHITHGIPKPLRKYDENGEVYAAPGTDGCDYIDNETFDIVPCANFYSQEVHEIRVRSLQGDTESLEKYENWFNNMINNLPAIHHFSWFNLERKINTYKNYWSKHWQSLYNVSQDDTAENNMFFNKPWSDVTDEEITDLASDLAEKTGGWIFHRKLDLNQPTPYIDCEIGYPSIMENWIKKNSKHSE